MIVVEKKEHKRQSYKSGVSSAFVLSLLCSVTFSGHALALEPGALPQNGQVEAGDVSLDYSTANELHINQNSDRAVINWDSFNVGKDGVVAFHQPGSDSLTVNRVLGAGDDPSQILGTMRANGRVLVLDRNGVIFGKDAVIDVGGIIVGAGDIDTDTFMAGGDKIIITDVNQQAHIVNNGQINVAEAGLAAFVAPNVSNNGVIRAKSGRVQIGASTQATIDLYGDGLLELAVDEGLEHAMITNTGEISADGGVVHISAAMAKDTVDSVINMNGVTTVASATQSGGRIVLEGANTTISGTLDASGATGGGEILIGGDYKGEGSIRHANKTYITSDAEVLANALQSGDGGKIIVWADEKTEVAGNFEAKGGVDGGNGGFIETSSKKHLTVDSDTKINVSAPQGNGGEWLIDPEDIVISDGGNDGDANTSDVATATINATLNGGGDVTITTSGTGPGVGNITLNNATIDKSSSNNSATLTFVALKDIISTNSSINSSSGDALNVTFNADSDGGMDGGIQLTDTVINTQGGSVVAGGGADPTTTRAYGSTDGVTDYGVGLNNTQINTGTGSGSVTLLGYGETTGTHNHGVHIENLSTITTDSGTIKLDGWGGDSGGNNNYGVYIHDNGTSVTTTSGVIDIDGRGESNSSSGMGVLFNLAASVSSTGSGSVGEINIRGIGDDNGGSDRGFYITSGNTELTSVDADINIYASSGKNAVAFDMNGSNSTSQKPKVETTGTGSIDIEAVSATGTGFSSNSWTLVRATGSGNVKIDATGDSRAFYLRRTDITANTGTVELIGTSTGTDTFYIDKQVGLGSTNGGDFLFTANKDINMINGSTLRATNGNLTITAEDFKITGGTPSISGDTVTIKTFDPTKNIGVGSGSGDMHLNTNEIERLGSSTQKLIIGDSVNGSGTIDIDTVDVSAESYDLEVYGGNVTVDTLDGPDSLLLVANGGAVTLDGAVSATGANESVVIAGDSFVNNAGAAAIDAGTGRFLIYADQFSDLTDGGLTASNFYGATYPANAPNTIAAGDRFIYQQQPTLTITADNAIQTTENAPAFTYDVTGLRAGDLLADSLAGLPTLVEGGQVGENQFSITASLGTLTSANGYVFDFVSGVLTKNTATLSEEELTDSMAVNTVDLIDFSSLDRISSDGLTPELGDANIEPRSLAGLVQFKGVDVSPAPNDGLNTPSEDESAKKNNEISASAGSSACFLVNGSSGACIMMR